MSEKSEKALPKQGVKALMAAWSKANEDMIKAKREKTGKKPKKSK